MAELETYFFDSYAFYEIIEGNENYAKYKKDIGIVTTKLNLMELHYGLFREYGKEVANKFYLLYSKYCVEVSENVIKEANFLKYFFKKRKLSYIDCIGYIIAKKKGIKFLTGDIQFEDIDNVEYVK